MSRRAHMFPPQFPEILVCLAFCHVIAYGQIPARDWVRFVSDDKAYEVSYPSGWRTLGKPEAVLDIVDFPESEQIRGVIIPEGGSRITVMQAPNRIRSVQEWAQNDQKFAVGPIVAPIKVVAPTETKRKGKSDSNSVFESHWRSSIGPGAELEEVAFYVVADSRLFKVQLTYGPENTDSARLRSVALEMAVRIKVLR